MRVSPRHRQSGQSLLETALLMPLMLLVVLNAVNFGVFFVVALNLAAAPRSGVEYSILGFATPGSFALPPAGPPSDSTTISYLSQQDLSGSLFSPAGALLSLQVCSQVLGFSGSGGTQKVLCTTCSGSSCGAAGAGIPIPESDPEAPTFVLHRVDTDYIFSPFIPGTPFGLALLPIPTCTAAGLTGVTCRFHRQVSMRAMN